MATTIHTPIRRAVLISLAVLAILLAGLAAAPAEARPQGGQADMRQALRIMCESQGGYFIGDWWTDTIYCIWPDGSDTTCNLATGQCTTHLSSADPDDNPLQPASRGQPSPVGSILGIRPGTYLEL